MSLFDQINIVCTNAGELAGRQLWDCESGYSDAAANARIEALVKDMPDINIAQFKTRRYIPYFMQSHDVSRILAPIVVVKAGINSADK